MNQQYAKVALDMIAQVHIKANDNDIAVAAQVRAMLHGIATGELQVIKAVPEKPASGEPVT